MKEIWKDIKGFEGLYQVNNFGKIKSMKTGKSKKSGISNRGYEVIYLHKNSKQYTKTVHRLVATAFIPNDKNLKEINHKNGNKLDNQVSNLEWVTRSQNVLHAYENGLRERNTKLPKNNSSGEIGVFYDETNKSWRAVISVNNENIYLGSFDEFERALIARKAAEKALTKVGVLCVRKEN